MVGARVGRMAYPALHTLFDELLPAGLQRYWKGVFARELSDGAIAAHLEHGARAPCIESSALVFPLDGACRRVALDETAYAYRDAAFSTVVFGAWPDRADDARNVRWVREYCDALRPFSQEGGYLNFLSDDDQDRVRANYRDHYARLVEIKSRCDPTNLFQLNQNIPPVA